MHQISRLTRLECIEWYYFIGDAILRSWHMKSEIISMTCLMYFFIFFHPIFEGLAKTQNYERWWLRCQIYSFYQFQSNVLLMLRPGKGIIIFIWSTCCHWKSNIHLESSDILPTRQSESKQYSYFVKPDQ